MHIINFFSLFYSDVVMLLFFTLTPATILRGLYKKDLMEGSNVGLGTILVLISGITALVWPVLLPAWIGYPFIKKMHQRGNIKPEEKPKELREAEVEVEELLGRYPV